MIDKKKALQASELRRHTYYAKDIKEWVVAAYFELEDRRLVMAIKRHKHKSMAVKMAMQAARERVAAGDFQEVSR